MDFFQQQAQAKKRTALLLFLYILGVIALTGIPVVLLCVGFFSTEGGASADPASFALTVAAVAGFMLLLILGGTLFKTVQLSAGGGKAVAESLGGRQISPSSRNAVERRLYNVVEEMALAAGVPVPAIYIMDNEHSINAFAAGFSPNEAVIGCNLGTVELLTRDELQGVIAHEFSHILNGDMRMNLRLIGMLFGLQVLALAGYYAMRFSYLFSSSSSSNRNDKGSTASVGLIMLVGGLAVMVIGYIGVFFSALIQAAISRQREFLADASAVQFTRNPAGIAGALKKIGCPDIGSQMQSPAAAEASHLFFGNACGLFSFGELLATHPPLPIRIKRIDPQFDGKFPARLEPVNLFQEERQKQPASNSKERLGGLGNILGGVFGGTLKREPDSVSPVATVSASITPQSVAAASALIQQIPPSAAESSCSPLTAKATFYAVLLDADYSIRQRQFASLAAQESDYLLKVTKQLYDEIQNADAAVKIPLAQRIMATLRQLTVSQYQHFARVVDALIAADDKMDLLEYTLKALLFRDLDIYFGLAKPLTVRYKTLQSVEKPIVTVLSYLAYSGHAALPEVQKAFQSAMQSLGLSQAILSTGECSSLDFDRALRVLAETEPLLKKRIFESFLFCIQSDGKITPKEGERIRAVAAMLAIPMPRIAVESRE